MTTDQDTTLATEAESLVLIFPCPWESLPEGLLDGVHAEHWQEEATYELNEATDSQKQEGITHVGTISFAGDDFIRASLIIEEPLPGLESLAGTSAEPLTATEIVMLEQHQSVCRVILPAGRRLGRRAAKRASQIMATMVEAGAIAAFLPGILRLHGARFVRRQTMDLYDPTGVANLFIGAWHDGDWMRTRGLTAFALPELETSTKAGMNGAYFTLMDVAANMLMQMAKFPDGAELQIGHKTFTLQTGPMSDTPDEEAPINGSFGVQTIV